MKKFTLIIIGLIGYLGIGLISPSLGKFALDFPEASESTVAMVVTTPAITLLVGLFAVSGLCKIFSRKHLLVVGILLVVLGGMMPAFLNTVGGILLCRGVLGIGMGFLMPIQTSYFAEYSEDERSVLFGANGAVNGLLSSGAFFVIGACALGWRSLFGVYGLFVLLIIMVLVFLPPDPKNVIQETTATNRDLAPESLQSNRWQFIFYYVAVALAMASYFIMPTTIAFYLEQNALGGISEAGMITGIGTLCMAVGGIFFAWLRKTFGVWLLPLTLAVCALGFFLYAKPMALWQVILAFGLVSVGESIFATGITMNITGLVPVNKIAFFSACYTSFIFLGQFISPYYQLLVMKVMGTASPTTAYLGFGVIMVILMAANILLERHQTSQAKNAGQY